MARDPRVQCIRAIVMAQESSDGGKGKANIISLYPGCKEAGRMGYSIKPTLIRKALQLIDSHPRMGINYWVCSTPDQNGNPSVLVYFEILEADGTRYQISFHNPHRCAGDLFKWVGKGRPTHWNKKKNGSRQSCDELILKYLYNWR